jgi:hypothetical protein
LLSVTACNFGVLEQSFVGAFVFGVIRELIGSSGHSLLHPPRPIDLSQARNAAFTLDLNLDDDEALAEHHLNHSGAAHGLSSHSQYSAVPETRRESSVPQGDRSQAGRDRLDSDDEDAWDRMG